MTLSVGLDRTSSASPFRTNFHRILRNAFSLASLAVLSLACLAGMPLAAQTAHAGAVIPVGGYFGFPNAVARDANGNVFVTDGNTHSVYEIVAVGGMVSSSSTVQTITSGFSVPAGVAVDGNGNLFVADFGNNTVNEIVAVGGVIPVSPSIVPLATVNGNFNGPLGVAVDASGNVFVADNGNHAVKEIVAVGGYVTVNTIGSGFSLPYGVTVDRSGNVFVGDNGTNAVYEIVAVGGVVNSSSAVNTIASGFSSPRSVAADGNGNVFVADNGNHAVKEIVAAPQKLPTTAVASTSASLSIPFTFDSVGSVGGASVLTQGAAGLDFADAGTGSCTANGSGPIYAIGDTCTVDVTFTPKYPGQRMGAVELQTMGGATIATAHIYGTGTGPLVTFPSNQTVNIIAGGFNVLQNLA
ncbi:MAG: NHL repeat-containing protein, partial [Edaphobacter sp.]